MNAFNFTRDVANAAHLIKQNASQYVTPSTSGLTAGNYLANKLDVINRTASENSAFNASEAALQRSWQEQANAKAMEFNASQAALNRDWQAFMSNTAHQREVADLKAAGLNPVLSAMNGNGAAVTSGATASGVVSSGASASADTSANAAIVGILSAIINANQQLEAANINARTQEAVADKYTAMSEITSKIAAAASMYGSEQMAGASMYGARASYAASKYAIDNPNSFEAVLARIMAGMLSDDSGSVSGFGQSTKDWFMDLVTGDKTPVRSGSFGGKK